MPFFTFTPIFDLDFVWINRAAAPSLESSSMSLAAASVSSAVGSCSTPAKRWIMISTSNFIFSARKGIQTRIKMRKSIVLDIILGTLRTFSNKISASTLGKVFLFNNLASLQKVIKLLRFISPFGQICINKVYISFTSRSFSNSLWLWMISIKTWRESKPVLGLQFLVNSAWSNVSTKIILTSSSVSSSFIASQYTEPEAPMMTVPECKRERSDRDTWSDEYRGGPVMESSERKILLVFVCLSARFGLRRCTWLFALHSAYYSRDVTSPIFHLAVNYSND